jgi:hypothetical protein
MTSAPTSERSKRVIYLLGGLLLLLAVLLITYWAGQGERAFDENLLLRAIAVGVVAQLVDGALGMAYGVTATTFLLSTGIPPLVATASVHISEIFTTAASGLSHWHRGNVERQLFLRLLIPGVIGGITGVALVTQIDSVQLKPWRAGYLFVMGLYLLSRVFRKIQQRARLKNSKIVPLALFGAFVDAVGGGGWGPVVTTTLLGTGHEPRTTIGSVNAAEFFITLVTGISFAVIVGLTYWETTAGLIIGGFLSAPLAVVVVSRLNPRGLMLMVGLLICSLSGYTVYHAL